MADVFLGWIVVDVFDVQPNALNGKPKAEPWLGNAKASIMR